MSTVGIKELKNRLTHYLRQVKKGGEVIITERDVPVALIQRIDAVTSSVSVEAKLAKMAADGEIVLPSRGLLRKVRKIKVKGKEVSRVIVEDREDRF
jgi:prevent-host-death family protein